MWIVLLWASLFSRSSSIALLRKAVTLRSNRIILTRLDLVVIRFRPLVFWGHFLSLPYWEGLPKYFFAFLAPALTFLWVLDQLASVPFSAHSSHIIKDRGLFNFLTLDTDRKMHEELPLSTIFESNFSHF